MNKRERAAWEVHEFLVGLGVPYAVIGGMAVQHWGEPRFTQDVDVTVTAPLDDPDRLIRDILRRFPSRVEDAISFARRNRVILIRAGNGCNIDISLALPGYEDEVMRRVVNYEIAPGKVIRLCSAEDLIIHKAVAGRPQDVRDIEGVVYRQRDALDTTYIQHWLRDFSAILDRSDMLELFERPWKRIHTE